MKKFKVCYIDGDKEIANEEVTAGSHLFAYQDFVELKGIRNYPVRTIDLSLGSKEFWDDHQASLKEKGGKIEKVEKIEKNTESSKSKNEEYYNSSINQLEISNRILRGIEKLQADQVKEIKTLQFWMRFGFFLILVQILLTKMKLGL